MSIDSGKANSVSSSSDANRALGKSLGDVVAAVDAARAEKAGQKAAVQAAREALSSGRQATSAQADAALGRSREETVQIVDAVSEAAQAEQVATETTDGPDGPGASSQASPPASAPHSRAEDSEIRKREAQLVDRQRRLARDREEFDAYRRKTESELAQAREMVRAAQQDPVGWLQKTFNISPSALASLKPAGEPAPLPPELQREIASFRAERETFARQQHELAQQRELDKFAADARAGADKWPLASRYSEPKLKQRGWEIALTSAQRGVTLSNEDVLDRIEEELSEIANLKSPARNAAKSSSSPSTQAATEHSAAQTTLTPRGASETANIPAKSSQYSKRELMNRSVAAVEEALKARRAAGRV